MSAAPSPSHTLEGRGGSFRRAAAAESGDADGACNRAYYAMFDAAHAALFALHLEGLTSPIKTHRGLTAQFGQHVVRADHLPDIRRALNKVQTFRQFADYSGDPLRREMPRGRSNRPRRSSPPFARVSCRRPTIVRLRYAIAHRQMARVKIAFVRPPLSPGFPGLSVAHLDMSFDRFPAGGQCGPGNEARSQAEANGWISPM